MARRSSDQVVFPVLCCSQTCFRKGEMGELLKQLHSDTHTKMIKNI